MIYFDHEMERRVLGSALTYPQSCMVLVDMIKQEDVFTDVNHRYTYKAILSVYQSSQTVDMASVGKKLSEMKFENRDNAYLITSDLAMNADGSATTVRDCQYLLQFYVQRRTIKAGKEIESLVGNESLEAPDLITSALDIINKIDSDIQIVQSESFDDQVEEAKQTVLNLKEGEINGLRLGIYEFDRVVGGIKDGSLVIFAGRPGMGKSAVALSLLKANAKRGMRGGLVSREMPAQQVIRRLIASESDFTMDELFNKGLRAGDEERFSQIADEISLLDIWIDDRIADLSDLIFQAKKQAIMHDLKFLVIDYLQLLRGFKNERYNGKHAEIGEITRTLKQLALSLNIPIILLSQLSRAVEQRGGMKRPVLSDLRESGSIEEDADLVVFLYRPEYYDIEYWDDEKAESTENQLEFIYAKNRTGKTGKNRCGCDLSKMRLYDLDTMNEIGSSALFDEDNDIDQQPF